MNTNDEINILLGRAHVLIRGGKDFLRNEGKALELTKWLTIAEYAQKYNITTQVVSKWIERGVITEDDYVEVGKFGKKLVRDVAFKG